MINGTENLNILSGISSQIIAPKILWAAFAIIAGIYAIISIILFYHWSRYGMNNRYIYLAEGIFVVVSIILLLVAVGSIVLFQNL